MYHPTSRVLAVLELLHAYERMTGAEMARRLEVNVRTLRRYITMLQDIGIPIIADRGRNGAYTLGTGFKLPPMMFTNDEAVALEIGLIAASQLGLTESVSSIASARAKLEHVMPLELQRAVHALSESIVVDAKSTPVPPSSAIMVIMSRAVQGRQRVQIRYRSDPENETIRSIDPYGIACWNGCWYVIGWCHLREAMRSFRLDRVIDADLTAAFFEAPTSFDALRHLKQSVATLPRQYEFTILLRTNLITAQREIFDLLGVLEPDADGILLRGSVSDLNWLARQLARLPFDFVVREPVELRAALREHAAALFQIADDKESD